MPRSLEITTLTTAATEAPGGAGGPCETGRTCEGVHTLADRPDEYYVITTEVTDPEVLAAFASRVGAGERLGVVARRIIDEVPR
jgi:hypothetical protein